MDEHVDGPLSRHAADPETLIMLASNRIEIGTDGPLTNVSLEPTYSLYLHRLRENYVFGLTRRTSSHNKVLRSAVFRQGHAVMRAEPVSHHHRPFRRLSNFNPKRRTLVVTVPWSPSATSPPHMTSCTTTARDTSPLS